MDLPELLPIGAAIASFAVAAVFAAWVSKQKPGTKEMMEISEAVRVGAAAFLKREMKIIIPIAVGLSVIIGYFIGYSNGIAFAVGATLSAIAGMISLKITVKAAVRAANLSGSGLGKTFALAFRGGATVGLAVPAMALLAITLLYFVFPDPITIAGVGIGASLIALFIRIGGGIFTKAADMAADLVGKIEVNIPEDDPRNPATIADNVGDNVGDAAGMGSDVYESYIVTMLATLLIAALIGAPENFLYPILIGPAARGCGTPRSAVGGSASSAVLLEADGDAEALVAGLLVGLDGADPRRDERGELLELGLETVGGLEVFRLNPHADRLAVDAQLFEADLQILGNPLG